MAERENMARRQPYVLRLLDNASTQLYHYKGIGIAGLGMFSDAYDLFSISLVTDLLGRIYYPLHGKLPLGVYVAVVVFPFAGAVVGQLVFGWLGDRVGRKPMYGVTLKLMAVCSIASGFSFRGSRDAVIGTLCFFRFWLGFSVGGDYPLSATIMSEYGNKKNRGAFIASIFAMQGLGNLVASVVAIIVSISLKQTRAYRHDPFAQADYAWRIIHMFGAVPAVLTYYSRRKMPETARYTALIARNAKQAASDMASVLDIVDINDIELEEANELVDRRVVEEFSIFSKQFVLAHGVKLLATTVCWHVLDVSFYSLNLFMKDIFSHIGWFGDTTAMSPLEQTFRIARTQALVALCGNLPGYLFTVFFIDRIGRKKIQLLGFAMMIIFMLGLAIPYRYWASSHKHIGFVAMYGCILFASNFGPNSTTFIIPVEIFPARLRATCHGISGAGGKLGAIVGVLGFCYFRWHSWFIMLIVYSAVGFAFTFLLPEPNGRSLENLSGETDEVEPPEDVANVAAGVDDEIQTV